MALVELSPIRAESHSPFAIRPSKASRVWS